MELHGQCHCGAVQVSLSSTRAPADLPVRICACTYCTRAAARYTSDPAGAVVITAAPQDLGRYRFGLDLADFLHCARCGIYVGAFDDTGLAVINVNILDDAPAFTTPPTTHTFDGENADARRARRARGWTPARIA
jgi:hypothetical protein